MASTRIQKFLALGLAGIAAVALPLTTLNTAAAGGCGTLWAHRRYCQASATMVIHIPAKTTGTSVRGELSNLYDVDRFILSARAAQHLTVSVAGAPGSARVFVLRPNGTVLEGAPGGVDIAKLPLTGAYRIRVIESTMGQPWSGKYSLKVTLK